MTQFLHSVELCSHLMHEYDCHADSDFADFSHKARFQSFPHTCCLICHQARLSCRYRFKVAVLVDSK